MTVRLLVALLVLVAGSASAEPLRFPGTPAQLDLGEGWASLTPPPASGGTTPLGQWRHRDGTVLALVRTVGPNGPAWATKTRADWARELEAGIKAAAPGYRRRGALKIVLRNQVPVLDLSFDRTVSGKRERVELRMLLFRTQTVIATAVGKRGARRAVERLMPPPATVP